jgi:Ca-activated chloride channel family protein
MQKLLILLFLLLTAGASMYGQNAIHGRVIDADSGIAGEGMVFATVVLYQADTLLESQTTDLDGGYFFANLRAGTYKLEVSFLGYATQRMEGILLKPGARLRLDVQMTSAALLDEVVVTGYRVPLIEQDNTTQGRTVVTSEEMRAQRKEHRPRKIATGATGLSPASPSTSGIKDQEPRRGSAYNKIVENDFIKTNKEPISTLSTDVDRAAYTNVRGLINAGQEVPEDAVRIEEMINYFCYSDPFPRGEDPVAATTELSECPWNPDNQLLRIGVRARGMHPAQAPASNVVFLVDVSGSMSNPNKLPLVTQGLKMVANNLRQEDKVSIVVYAGAAGLVLPPTSGGDRNKIIDALNKLSAGGSTAGGAGIQLAYKTARDHFIEGGNNRIILVTDGDFNVGTSDQDALVALVEKERESGVFLTIIGCGQGNYQEGMMQELADRGNGNHGFLDSYAEARKLLVDEFGGTVYTVAKDVKLQLEFNPELVAGYRLIGYENRLLNTEDFDDDTKDAAEMGAGHVVTVLYEIEPVRQRKAKAAAYLGELRLRYKQPNGDTSKKMTWNISAKASSLTKASDDLRWAAAVAEFGLLLRDSKFKGEATYERCEANVQAALGPDPFGYRKEMLELLRVVKAKK